MKAFEKTLLLILIIISIARCSGDNANSPDRIPNHNSYVSTFTGGTINRVGSNILLELSVDIPDTLRATIPASDAMSIKPATPGRFVYANEHTLQFIPDGALPFQTQYSMTVDLSKWFNDVNDEERLFTFYFNTAALEFRAAFVDMEVTANNNYIYTFQLTASDYIEDKQVENLISFSEKPIKVEWSHTPNSLTHTAKCEVKAPAEQEALAVETRNDKESGLTEETLLSVDVMPQNEFRVQEIRMMSDDTKYVEIIFNKNIDSKQNLMGLAYIKDNESRAVDVKGNKIRLYPDYGKQKIAIVLSTDIRCTTGETLIIDEATKEKLREFHVDVEKPAVEFATSGVIVPNGNTIQIPFKAIYMRGVQVRVFHIYQKNICQALQRGDINAIDGENFMYVARPVAVKTLFLDDAGDPNRIKHWGHYSIDLSDIMQTEPGAIYRVELNPRAELTAWDETEFQKETKEQAYARDKADFADLKLQFDRGSWSYYDNYDENNNYWWSDDEPSRAYYYRTKIRRRNVLATNIGLSALANDASEMSIVAINLQTAQPMSGVDIELFGKQNQSIGKLSTDGNGIATFNLLNSATPIYVIAHSGDDFSYLRVAPGESLSTSTFDVSGLAVTKGIKGYIYGERGVWRPGDTLHISFMLYDPDKTLPENYPVSLRLDNPLGQTQTRLVNSNGVSGLYTYNIPTDANAPTGSWTAYVNVGDVSFSKSIRIETIKPNRLKIDLTSPSDELKYNSQLNLHTEWLTGMTAHNLNYSIDASFSKTKTTWSNYKNFIFDDPACDWTSDETRIAESTTDNDGNASIRIAQAINGAPGKVMCNLSTRVYEPSGEYSIDAMRMLYSPYNQYVGIKEPNKEEDFFMLDTQHTFELVNVDTNGKPQANAALEVCIYKMEWSWWWDSSNGSLASYVSDNSHKPVKRFTVTTQADGKATFPVNLSEWGRYLIRATNKQSGHSTGVTCWFDSDYYSHRADESGQSAATVLDITTNKESYNVGETMQVNIPSSEGSCAIVSVCRGERILSTQLVNCGIGKTNISIPTTDKMLPNVYIYISLIQPYNQTNNDRPIRLYGIKSVNVNSERSKLNPTINMSDEIRPESKCKITIAEKDGRPMAYTLAIVDDGLLDLTRFKTPNAWDLFNGREALGVRMWDLYNNVSGAFGGRIEQVFSIGGDESLNANSKTMQKRFVPMVYFAGPFTLKSNGKNTHNIDIPNYVGSVRVMVVAADGAAYGNADKTVKVTKPVMVLPTMPRLLGVDDETTVTATIFANTQKSGAVETTISVDGDAQIIGSKSKSLTFSKSGDQSVTFRLKAGKTEGSVKVRLTAKGLDDKSTAVVDLPIRAVSQNVISTTEKSVAPGAKTKFDANKGSVDFEVSTVKPLNLSNRLSFLLGIPYGCSEQITSKAFPQLLLDKFTKLTDVQRHGVEEAVKMVISKLPSYQTADGGISVWPNGSTPSLYNSAYVSLFLTEAQNCGYYVPETIVNRLTAYLKRTVKNWKSGGYSYENEQFAMAFYALSAARNADLSTMNRMRESRSKLSNRTLARLAAAYALAGHRNYAKELWQKINDDNIYPEELIAMVATGDQQTDVIAEKIRVRLSNKDFWWRGDYLSLSINAMSKYYQKFGQAKSLSFNINGDNVSSEKLIWRNSYNAKGKSFEIANKGESNIHVVCVNTYKAVQDSIRKIDSGLDITVRYYSATNGSEVDINNLTENTLRAVVSVRNTTGSAIESIALTHILPAGWEVLKASGSDEVSYQDVRDDRIYTYVDKLNAASAFTATIDISATYEGSYYVPAITAEAMYDNKVFGCTSSSHIK
ncbi:MAG: hypothetical protein K6G73_06285 [Marinilabiliaceae bacterium]|nr:hypothetical protein [Marinilabiliaceae bacterium]